jgi:hypothetical protein
MPRIPIPSARGRPESARARARAQRVDRSVSPSKNYEGPLGHVDAGAVPSGVVDLSDSDASDVEPALGPSVGTPAANRSPAPEPLDEYDGAADFDEDDFDDEQAALDEEARAAQEEQLQQAVLQLVDGGVITAEQLVAFMQDGYTALEVLQQFGYGVDEEGEGEYDSSYDSDEEEDEEFAGEHNISLE